VFVMAEEIFHLTSL